MKSYLVIGLFLMGGLLLSCSSDKPDNLMEEEIYIQILGELHIMRALENAHPNKFSRDTLLPLIFEHYNTTSDQFERSHEFYQSDIYSHTERLRTARDQLQDEYSRLNHILLEYD